jgi:hypothetical protein
MKRGYAHEPFFKAEVDVEWDAVGVPAVAWHRAGYYEWDRVVRKHKPQGRRRMTRDAVRATIGGVR